MKKYPIRSEKLQEDFEVKIIAGKYITGAPRDCTLVKLYKKKAILGVFKKQVKKQWYSENWGFDFMGMAKSIVINYEDSLEQEAIDREKEKEEIENFKKWDGIVK